MVPLSGWACAAHFGIDREQNSQTQEASNESWPRQSMIAYESHVHLPQQVPFWAALYSKSFAFRGTTTMNKNTQFQCVTLITGIISFFQQSGHKCTMGFGSRQIMQLQIICMKHIV